jgi:hypothetical protein
MGLSVRDDPPKIIDPHARTWGELRSGYALSIEEEHNKYEEGGLPILSVCIWNRDSNPRTLFVPGWIFYFRYHVRTVDGMNVPMSAFGGQLLRPERRTESLNVAVASGALVEARIPIGSIFGIQNSGRYLVRVSCEPEPGLVLDSNEITL